MKNQNQLNLRMIYGISTQSFYLKKTIDQLKGSVGKEVYFNYLRPW